MRMAIFPGRGGRGMMVNKRMKYLDVQPPCLPYRNGSLIKNNKFGVLSTQYSDQNMDADNCEMIETQKVHDAKIIKDNNRNQDSFYGEGEDMGAPILETSHAKDMRTFTEVIRKGKKKKKYTRRSPKHFYESGHNISLEESTSVKFRENVNKDNTMSELSPLRSSKRNEQVNKDVEMSEIVLEDVEMQEPHVQRRDDMWARIASLCAELSVKTNVSKNDDITKLELVVEKLECKKMLKGAFNTSPKSVSKFALSHD